MVLVCETFLKGADSFSLPNFVAYRNDRTRGPGGGTMILIRRNVPHYEVPCPPLGTVEATTLIARLGGGEAISLTLTASFRIIYFLIALRIRESLTERERERLLFDVPEFLELFDDLVDCPWEHLQALHNTSMSDVMSEKLGDGGTIGTNLHS